MILSNTEPKTVMKYFEEICSIPHGSGNTKAISDYLVGFAKEKGFDYIQDELNNVVIFAPATAGYENSEPVIIQGHMDMVCVKDEESDVDFQNDGLSIMIDGDFVRADKTTLGGDDGIALAYAMAVMASDNVAHPPIEAVFTVDEEVGMDGASGLDASVLKGRTLLNIDSEQEGVFTVSCAGGANGICTIDVERVEAEGEIFEIVIKGLQGGHSGVEIHKGRGNSNILMGRLLEAMKGKIKIAELGGGSAGNAITLKTTAKIVADCDITSIIEKYDAIFKNELSTTDPDVTVECVKLGKGKSNVVKNTDDIVDFLTMAPNGIYAYSADIEGLVQTSLNMGIVKLESEKMTAVYALRSSVKSQLNWLKAMLKTVMNRVGGMIEVNGEYAEWEYRKDSKIREVMVEVYKEQTGKEPIIEAIHAGLECGIFAGKLDGLDCISFGPDLLDIHTSSERMSISSVQRTWELIKEVLKRLK